MGIVSLRRPGLPPGRRCLPSAAGMGPPASPTRGRWSTWATRTLARPRRWARGSGSGSPSGFRSFASWVCGSGRSITPPWPASRSTAWKRGARGCCRWCRAPLGPLNLVDGVRPYRRETWRRAERFPAAGERPTWPICGIRHAGKATPFPHVSHTVVIERAGPWRRTGQLHSLAKSWGDAGSSWPSSISWRSAGSSGRTASPARGSLCHMGDAAPRPPWCSTARPTAGARCWPQGSCLGLPECYYDRWTADAGAISPSMAYSDVKSCLRRRPGGRTARFVGTSRGPAAKAAEA